MPGGSGELTSEWKNGWPPGQYMYACAVGLSKCKHMLNYPSVSSLGHSSRFSIRRQVS